MSVDIKWLKKCGVSSGAYKSIWTKNPAEYTPRQKRLVDLISGEIRDTFEMNLRDSRAYHAVDLAYEVPFNQTTPTLVHHILSKNLNYQQTVEALKQYGLSESELYLDVPQADGSVGKMLNPPVFFQIYIPIVKAYVNAVLADIFNERNTSPLLPFNPLKQTDRNQVLCEIITDITQTQSTWYGYPSVMRQAIQQMLKYGLMMAFPREEWHYEKQQIDGDDGPELVTVKEGIRYTMPHPSRMGYDTEYPATSLNTDTGSQWALHWHILKYGTILDDRRYWNRSKIFAGTNWFQSPLAGNYFTEVFPCRLKFLEGVGWGPLSREDRVAWYNSSQDRDKAVFVTEYFRKLKPKDWDLADYAYPVWHRFTIAGDDTVIWCEPCAYPPAWFMGYDYDEMSARTPSMALEIIPWQDHLGNILSQMILTAKQNLLNVIFYDTNLVDKEEISRLQNVGERKYRSTMFIPYDSFKNAAARLNQAQAFTPVQLSKTPIQELLQMIPTVLNIMERVLQISPQQLGASATHQQSKAEVQQTAGSGNNRIGFISASVDEGIDAWKRQLYEGQQAYLDPQFVAEVSTDIKDVEKHISELGFTVKSRGDNSLLVTGHKKKLRLEGFAATNQGPSRQKDKEIAQIIFQVVGTVAGQEDLHKKIGAKNLLRLIEEAAKLAGAPQDFKLQLDQDAEDDQEIDPKIIEAIQQAQQATMQQVEEKIAKPVAQEVAQDQQKIQQIEGIVAQLQKIYQVAQQTQDKNAIRAKESQTKQQLKAAESAAAEQRKQQAFHAEEQRKTAALISKLQAEKAELQAKIAAMAAETHASIEAERTKAEAQAKAKAEAPKPAAS